MGAVTHQVTCNGGSGMGLYSLCKCVLHEIGEIHQRHPDARINITIHSTCYEQHGANVHTTYFQPDIQGPGGEHRTPPGHPTCGRTNAPGHELKQWMRDMHCANAHRYFTPRPELQVEIFRIRDSLGPNPLGIQYRGTDKPTETPIASLPALQRQVRAFVAAWRPSAVFLATDDLRGLEAVREVVPDCITLDHYRAEDDVGIHKRTIDPIRLGREAVIDAYVLASCSSMIAGQSNLPDWAAILSPEMPVIRLQ